MIRCNDTAVAGRSIYVAFDGAVDDGWQFEVSGVELTVRRVYDWRWRIGGDAATVRGKQLMTGIGITPGCDGLMQSTAAWFLAAVYQGKDDAAHLRHFAAKTWEELQQLACSAVVDGDCAYRLTFHGAADGAMLREVMCVGSASATYPLTDSELSALQCMYVWPLPHLRGARATAFTAATDEDNGYCTQLSFDMVGAVSGLITAVWEVQKLLVKSQKWENLLRLETPAAMPEEDKWQDFKEAVLEDSNANDHGGAESGRALGDFRIWVKARLEGGPWKPRYPANSTVRVYDALCDADNAAVTQFLSEFRTKLGNLVVKYSLIDMLSAVPVAQQLCATARTDYMRAVAREPAAVHDQLLDKGFNICWTHDSASHQLDIAALLTMMQTTQESLSSPTDDTIDDQYCSVLTVLHSNQASKKMVLESFKHVSRQHSGSAMLLVQPVPDPLHLMMRTQEQMIKQVGSLANVLGGSTTITAVTELAAEVSVILGFTPGENGREADFEVKGGKAGHKYRTIANRSDEIDAAIANCGHCDAEQYGRLAGWLLKFPNRMYEMASLSAPCLPDGWSRERRDQLMTDTGDALRLVITTVSDDKHVGVPSVTQLTTLLPMHLAAEAEGGPNVSDSNCQVVESTMSDLAKTSTRIVNSSARTKPEQVMRRAWGKLLYTMRLPWETRRESLSSTHKDTATALGESLDSLHDDIESCKLEYRFELATQLSNISELLSSKRATNAMQQAAIEDLNPLLGLVSEDCPARTDWPGAWPGRANIYRAKINGQPLKTERMGTRHAECVKAACGVLQQLKRTIEAELRATKTHTVGLFGVRSLAHLHLEAATTGVGAIEGERWYLTAWSR